MEEAKGNAGPPSRVFVAAAPPSSSARDSKESLSSAKRHVYSVELYPEKTTIVSWKKLLKESNKGSVNPHDSVSADAAAIQPLESEIQDVQPSNRFNAVIEKIERMYMGEQSSDGEDLDDIPDDDQYDTEDSFIDDAELDDYFQVDKLSTKHNGYFVNRGKLEQIKPSSSPIHDDFSHSSKPSSSPKPVPKKRRRKDSTKLSIETSDMDFTNDIVGTDNVQINTTARRAPLMGNNFTNIANIQTVHSEHYKERKILKNKSNTLSGRISKDASSPSMEPKNLDKYKAGTLVSKDLAHKSRLINESVDSVYHASRDRPISSHVESQSRKSLNYKNEAELSTKVRRKEKYGTDGLPRANSAVGVHAIQVTQPSSTRVKDGSATRPKGTTLEKAINDLEKIVALHRPPNLDFQEVDTSDRGANRRLPQEVKQNLAKVARLSASQNKIPEDVLLNRLMGIVGHMVQRKTLKRNLREIVELGLAANQEKSDRFKQIKQEVNEMIRTRVSFMKSKMSEQHDGSADDFQEVNGGERKSLRRHNMDIALEDKICDLYNLFVEGLDADKSSERRKLYGENCGQMVIWTVMESRMLYTDQRTEREHEFTEIRFVKKKESRGRSWPLWLGWMGKI
ncbi:ubinuclein-2-like isoform X3 [Asparagus officinalis]|uniref:ubinuclein-2-like isoform X3 n=1 Tax=Asparagus officinalis TaxID=4686 RepID=UPI00098E4F99|nr:ubinuclein-2-like isoform X3 [Asparagus officinalis]